MEYKISPAAQEYLNQYLDNLENAILESASSKDQRNIDLEDIVMSIRKNKRSNSILFGAILKTNPKLFIFPMGIFSIVLIGIAIASIYHYNEVFDLNLPESIFFIVLGILYGTSAILLTILFKVKPTTNRFLLVKYWKTLEVYARENLQIDKRANISQIVDFLASKTEN